MPTRFIVAFVLLFATASAQAQTETAGPYAGFSGGLTILQDSDLTISGGATGSGTLEFDPGFTIGVQGGYKFPQGFRPEFEYRFTRAEMDRVTGTVVVPPFIISGSGPVDGAVWSHALMGNLWYDIDTGTRWSPYLGGGVGVAIVDATDSTADTVFGWQAGAGVGFVVTPKVVIDVGYRWLATTNPEFDDLGVKTEAEYSSHNFIVGVRGHF